jgi:hypothetical protein
LARRSIEAELLPGRAFQKVQEIDEIRERLFTGLSLRTESRHVIGAVPETRVSSNEFVPSLPSLPESSVPLPIGESLDTKLHPSLLGTFAEEGFKILRVIAC